MKKQQLDFLRSLCEARTPSGAEIQGQRIVAGYAKPYAGEIRLDRLGNLHAVVNPGAGCRVMIDAHCDEIGLLVQYIDEKGFIFFSPVGGVNKQLLPGERVVLCGPDGPVNGVIGSKPIHLAGAKERESGVGEITDLWIDIGASSKKEAEKAAPPGTFGVVDSAWRPLLGDRVSARALDDRCGVFVIMEALRLMHGGKPKVACHFVSAAQEELGLLGAKTAAFEVDPQLGISVDVTFASDDPRSDPRKVGDIRVGLGPVLAIGPNYDPGFNDFVRKTAAKAGINVQIEPAARGSGTDGFAIRHTRCGVPVVQLSLALRYMHSAVEVVSLKDLEDTARLIAEVLLALPARPKFGFRL